MIAAECHINPSLSEYVETDLSTGQSIRDLLGYDKLVLPLQTLDTLNSTLV